MKIEPEAWAEFQQAFRGDGIFELCIAATVLIAITLTCVIIKRIIER